MQIDSGADMDETFKKTAKAEIDEFKADLRRRFPDRSPEQITDEDLLREVLNTVGKPGRLGESIKCVVSVSMLTEGWDANTVTHILGVRAFGTQLLCEQVVGRGLRRVSDEPREDGLLEPEYAEVYGVRFSFIPTAGTTTAPPMPKAVHRVRSLPERSSLTIEFPRVVGYRYELPVERGPLGACSQQFTRIRPLVFRGAHGPRRNEGSSARRFRRNRRGVKYPLLYGAAV